MSERALWITITLVVLQVLVVLVFKRYGDHLLAICEPMFTRLFSWINLLGQREEDSRWEIDSRTILNSTPANLTDKVRAVLARFGKLAAQPPISKSSEQALVGLPQILREFFSSHDSLSFMEGDRTLDRSAIRSVGYQKKHYIIIGCGDDDGELFAVDAAGISPAVTSISFDGDDIDFVDEVAPSVEQFILLRAASSEHAKAIHSRFSGK